jgi:hypothetical protein
MRQRAMVMLGFFGAFAVFLLIGLLLLNNPAFTTLGYVSIGLGAAMLLAVVVYTVMGYIQPAWIKRVAASGTAAPATLIENTTLKGIGGYQGEDMWLELPVKVQPASEPAFDAKMKCKLSQSLILKAGSQVQVRYDPADRTKVVLTSDPIKDLMAARRK